MDETQTVPVNGAEIYVEQAGEGPPLLLIHAGVADSRMWDDQVSAFSQRFRIVRYDLRGFGRSSMPPGLFSNHGDVAALLDELKIERAFILGVSFGGKIALDFALAYPERVWGLILGAPSIGGSLPSQRIKEAWVAEDEALEAGDLQAALEINLRLWVDGIYRQPDEVEAAVRQKVALMQHELFLIETPDDIEEEELEPPAAERVAEVEAPALILVGDLDLPEKVASARELAAQLPQAELQVMPGVAHMLSMENPQLFNEHVLSFLDGQLGPR